MPTVLAHLATLTQVVTNLLSNAIKFAGADTPPVVTVDAETKEDRVVLSVTDNGVGIPPDQRDTIFGVFQRAHRDQAFPGTGIGLAIVRKAIQRMNGRVGVESEVGRGSRFWIELPAAAENAVQHLPGTG